MNITTSVNLDIKPAMKVLGGDKLGKFASHDWHRTVTPYTPHRDGNLERNVTYKPWEFEYNEPYAAYMYGGFVYVDPKYGVGGFPINGGTAFFSRKGIKKIKSEREFKYSKAHNPKACKEWDKAAIRDGKDKELAEAIQDYINQIL